jgi:ribonuclease P/MRP protein subunit POP8
MMTTNHPPPAAPAPGPDTVDIDNPTPTATSTNTSSTQKPTAHKTRTITTTTLKNPPFAYAHLTLTTPPSTTATPTPSITLDAIQLRSYLTAALRQFLGDTGAGMSIDILLVEPHSAWVRVPREDLAAFAAGVTAFSGLPLPSGGGRMVLRLGACGDWLGSLIGREEEGGLWVD